MYFNSSGFHHLKSFEDNYDLNAILDTREASLKKSERFDIVQVQSVTIFIFSGSRTSKKCQHDPTTDPLDLNFFQTLLFHDFFCYQTIFSEKSLKEHA